jgi:hypothetical protein
MFIKSPPEGFELVYRWDGGVGGGLDQGEQGGRVG